VVSVALAIGLALVAGTLPDQPVRDATSGWREMAGTLAVANLALALFNLLPIFPMDGGRMFRALLSWWLGRSVGTGIAAWVGRIGGVGFILYGLVRGEFLLALIGGFVLLSASAESAAVARSTATDESAESGRTDR
jgi:Zn-dependent protease